MQYLLISLLCLFSVACGNAKESPIEPNEPAAMEESSKEDEKKLRHVVMFRWKEGTSAEKIKEIEAAFAALPSKIKEIVDFEWGLNNSPEGLDKGFTHCFFVTFASEEGRAVYLPHPDHKAFVALIGDYVDDVMVFDYWAE